MNEPSRKTRGYCPSVWTPMPSGDGLIVRVRPRHARASARHVAALARLAPASGNGIIELTRRGNLQIRGVSAASWPSLRAELVELFTRSGALEGLAGMAGESERHPALFVCPQSGLDPRCPPLEPLAEALEASFVLAGTTPPFAGADVAGAGLAERRLPDKFAIVLSGGSQSASELAADIHV